MTSFRAQLEIALETDLPIVIHSRDADDDMADTLEEFAAKGPLKGVMHCFSRRVLNSPGGRSILVSMYHFQVF